MYEKPYPNWMDKLFPLPRSYKTLDFVNFFKEDGNTTIKHFESFTTYYAGRKHNEFHKLVVFPLSLTRTIFLWYFYPHQN